MQRGTTYIAFVWGYHLFSNTVLLLWLGCTTIDVLKIWNHQIFEIMSPKLSNYVLARSTITPCGCTMSSSLICCCEVLASWTDQVHLGSGKQNACGETMNMWMVIQKSKNIILHILQYVAPVTSSSNGCIACVWNKWNKLYVWHKQKNMICWSN